MSASEKLEALHTEMAEALLHGYVTATEGYRLFNEIHAALPEIIAVVKAAEGLALAIEEKCQNERSFRLDDALTALDEALPQIGSTSPPEGATSQ